MNTTDRLCERVVTPSDQRSIASRNWVVKEFRSSHFVGLEYGYEVRVKRKDVMTHFGDFDHPWDAFRALKRARYLTHKQFLLVIEEIDWLGGVVL